MGRKTKKKRKKMAIYPLRNLSLTPCIRKDFFPLGTVCYHEQFYAFLLSVFSEIVRFGISTQN